MLEFRFVEQFNRNYNTIYECMGRGLWSRILQCLQGLRQCGARPIAAVRASSNDRFPAIECYLILRRPLALIYARRDDR